MISPATSRHFTPHCPWRKVDIPAEQTMCFDCYYEFVGADNRDGCGGLMV